MKQFICQERQQRWDRYHKIAQALKVSYLQRLSARESAEILSKLYSFVGKFSQVKPRPAFNELGLAKIRALSRIRSVLGKVTR